MLYRYDLAIFSCRLGYLQLTEDKYWRADVLAMNNHQDGKATVLKISEWNFEDPRREGFFTPARLKNVR